jgi:hypothetical protein
MPMRTAYDAMASTPFTITTLPMLVRTSAPKIKKHIPPDKPAASVCPKKGGGGKDAVIKTHLCIWMISLKPIYLHSIFLPEKAVDRSSPINIDA